MKGKTMKTTVARTKKFVSDHRVAIAVTVTSACWATLMVRNANELNAFLKEHDLFDKYYDMSWDVPPTD